LDQKIGRLPAGFQRKIIAHILRYDLHFHQSLVHPLKTKLQENAPCGAKIHISRTTWRVIHFLCQAHLTSDAVSLSDVFLSIGVSKGTAISCLNNLEAWGVVIKTSDDGDKRRLNIQFSPEYESIIFSFIHYWAERYSQEVAPFEYSQGEVQSSSTSQLPPSLRQNLQRILTNTEMIRTQALGPVQPAGYVRYAHDIKELATEMLNDLSGSDEKNLKSKL